jgi:hypothetical protein
MYGAKWGHLSFMDKVYPHIVSHPSNEFDIGWNNGFEEESIGLLHLRQLANGEGCAQHKYKVLGPVARDPVTGVEYGSVGYHNDPDFRFGVGARPLVVQQALGMPLGLGLGGRDVDEFLHVQADVVRVAEGAEANRNLGVPGLIKLIGYPLLTHGVKGAFAYDYSGVRARVCVCVCVCVCSFCLQLIPFIYFKRCRLKRPSFESGSRGW